MVSIIEIKIMVLIIAIIITALCGVEVYEGNVRKVNTLQGSQSGGEVLLLKKQITIIKKNNNNNGFLLKQFEI